VLSTVSIPNTAASGEKLPQEIQVNPNTIPARLKAANQWVVWHYVTRGGGRTKVLQNPRTGHNADTTKRETWGTFEQAWTAYTRPHSSYSGVGFVFSADDDLVGLDFDKVTGSPDDLVRGALGHRRQRGHGSANRPGIT